RRGSSTRCDLREGLLLGCKRLWCLLSWLSDDFLDAFSCASPHETSTFIISHRVHVEEFCFEGFEIIVIEAEPYFEGWIRHPSLAFEEVDDLGENLIEGHGAAPLVHPRAPWRPSNQPCQILR